jgi:hypothetical protein
MPTASRNCSRDTLTNPCAPGSNLFDLFGPDGDSDIDALSVPGQERRVEAIYRVAASPTPSDPGSAYAVLWREHLRACDAFRAAMAALRAGELAAQLVDEHYEHVFAADTGSRVSRRGQHDPLEVASSMVWRLVAIAARTFSGPGGAALKIDAMRTYHRFVCASGCEEAFDPAAFDPAAVWAALAEEYGGHNGVEHGYRQSAETFSHLFDLNKGKAVTRRRAGVVLVLKVDLDDFDSRHGRKRLAHNSREAIDMLATAIPVFASWVGEDDALVVGVQRLAQRFGRQASAGRWNETGMVVSRERIDVCEGLSLVTYGTRFEFVMAPALAEKLQLFLGLYGPGAD